MTEAGAQGIGGFYRGCLVLVDDSSSPFNGLQAHVKNVHAIGPSDEKLSLQLWSDGPNFQKLYVTTHSLDSSWPPTRLLASLQVRHQA